VVAYPIRTENCLPVEINRRYLKSQFNRSGQSYLACCQDNQNEKRAQYSNCALFIDILNRSLLNLLHENKMFAKNNP